MTMPAGWRPTNEQAPLGKEETLWRNQVIQGIFKKRVVEVQTITNYRVLRNDKGITFKDIDDVVVMNQHRVSQSNYTGTSYGRYARLEQEALNQEARRWVMLYLCVKGDLRLDLTRSQILMEL